RSRWERRSPAPAPSGGSEAIAQLDQLESIVPNHRKGKIMKYSKHTVELTSLTNAFVAASTRSRKGVGKSAQRVAVMLLLLIGLVPQRAVQAQAPVRGGGGRQGADVAPATGPAVTGG